MPGNKSLSRRAAFGIVLGGAAAIVLAQALFAPKIGRFAPVPGGLASGGRHDLTGFAGQAAGGRSTGGSFTLIGGLYVPPPKPVNAAKDWKGYP